ncbi:IS110 family transposase [Sphingomonas sp. ZB1N12]|jgi:transposase|uniref:IS110 family transposase n=1 Tax=Sphingomonas arabinosi TaxID=3096160 RepID=UPI002FCAD567
MGNVTTIGLDIAKNVFQVHGVDGDGAAVVRQRLTRGRMLKFFAKLPRCLIGIEACATSHFWARELVALGHDVKLMPAQYVKPYVKRGKNDAADAEAICEAVTRPTMRFVGIKSPEQQSAMMLHRVRLILNRQRTQLSNAMRAHLAEFGIAAPIGRNDIEQLLDVIADPTDERVPADARFCLEMLATQSRIVKEQILENDRRMASARETELGRRLMEIPGVGPLLASAIVATVPDPAIFRSGRNLAAWIGLVPRQNSSGGKERLGSITKAGHQYLRQMLIVGAMAVVRYAERNGAKRPWLVQLLARGKTKVAAVALANKNARIIWAMMASGERYREPQIA